MSIEPVSSSGDRAAQARRELRHRPVNTLVLEGGPSPSLQVRLMRYLEAKYPGFLGSTDLFAGTSNGSFVALFLASRLGQTPPEDALSILDAAIAFNNEILSVLDRSPWSLVRYALGWWPMHEAGQLRTVLEAAFGDKTLGDLHRHVVIMSYDKTQGIAKVFDNFLPTSPDNAARLVDVALSSSAFPTYLPIHRNLRDNHEYLDGALVANNPTMAALARTGAHLGGPGGSGTVDLVALTLGSSEPPDTNWLYRLTSWLLDRPDRDDPSSVSWGWVQWLLTNPLVQVDVITHGAMNEINDQAKLLLGPRYHRSNPPLRDIAYLFQTGFSSDTKTLIRQLDKQAAELCADPDPNSDVNRTLTWLAGAWPIHPPVSLPLAGAAAAAAAAAPNA
jgi:hypothetical protein